MKMWDLVEPSPNVNPVSCKRVVKIKWNSVNSIDHFKTTVVVQRFSQEEGFHFEDVFFRIMQYNTSFTFTSGYFGSLTSSNVCYYCLIKW